MRTPNGALTERWSPPSALGKRHADESNLNDDHRFAKRFNLLDLGKKHHAVEVNALAHVRGVVDDSKQNGNSNYYISVPGHARLPAPSTASAAKQPATEEEYMQVDDRPDRVYIHNLDEELAESEPEEERLVFLPDIERRFSRIPKHVLIENRTEESENQELVLYSIPKSLTVDESKDSVRKAIIETRRRARAKAVEDARHEDMNRRYDHSNNAPSTETAHGYGAGYEDMRGPDPDAMDIG